MPYKIIYRPHRGGLAESMAEAKEFNSIKDMKNYIVSTWDGFVLLKDIVVDRETREDKRIGWKNERYVCVKALAGENYIKKYGCAQCIGMCATDYPGRLKK